MHAGGIFLSHLPRLPQVAEAFLTRLTDAAAGNSVYDKDMTRVYLAIAEGLLLPAQIGEDP